VLDWAGTASCTHASVGRENTRPPSRGRAREDANASCRSRTRPRRSSGRRRVVLYPFAGVFYLHSLLHFLTRRTPRVRSSCRCRVRREADGCRRRCERCAAADCLGDSPRFRLKDPLTVSTSMERNLSAPSELACSRPSRTRRLPGSMTINTTVPRQETRSCPAAVLCR
jgi:hypothetical protein